jgi:hypothetical protein
MSVGAMGVVLRHWCAVVYNIGSRLPSGQLSGLYLGGIVCGGLSYA